MTIAVSSVDFPESHLSAVAGFAQRLAYLRWLRSFGRLKPETDREFAVALGVGEKWLSKWKGSEKPPEGRSEAAAIAEALRPSGVTVEWLYDGKGSPPQQVLWSDWLKGIDLPTGVQLEHAKPMSRSGRNRRSG